MQKLFYETHSLDRNAVDRFCLSEEILMENAAHGMASYIIEHFAHKSSLIVFCGSGNNGGDGLTLARMLYGSFNTTVIMPKEAKTTQSKLQLQRFLSLPHAEACVKRGLDSISSDTKVIIDCFFGTGFRGALESDFRRLLEMANQFDCYKIACDIPSGIDSLGRVAKGSFRADRTFSMGGHKIALFSDEAKDYVGEIEMVSLGINPVFFQKGESATSLLEESDFNPPFRMQKNSNKGDFGHLGVFCGQKVGASILASMSALSFGVGLVSVIDAFSKKPQVPYEIMVSEELPHNANAVALGMGLGRECVINEKVLEVLQSELPKILDADIFYHRAFYDNLSGFKNTVITPHPKEFLHILNSLELQCPKDVAMLQKDRFTLAQSFSTAYPNLVLVLKGANTIIAHNGSLFINPLGSNALAKGGSGDVLSGLIGGLLAQGYSGIVAAIQGSLAHTIAAKRALENIANFALTPKDLIQSLKFYKENT